MAILDDSRYNNQPVYTVRVDRVPNRAPAIYHQGYYPQQFAFVEYQIQELDRIDHLAYRFLNDSTLWWIIAAANPKMLYPKLQPGQIIRIPTLGNAV